MDASEVFEIDLHQFVRIDIQIAQNSNPEALVAGLAILPDHTRPDGRLPVGLVDSDTTLPFSPT